MQMEHGTLPHAPAAIFSTGRIKAADTSRARRGNVTKPRREVFRDEGRYLRRSDSGYSSGACSGFAGHGVLHSFAIRVPPWIVLSLAGRTALITGGSRGIGRMIAAGFIAQGARVYISCRKAAACEETAAELSRNGGTCLPLPQDVSTVEGARLLARAYGEREPKLDILVNNAGAAWLAEFDAFPEKGWDKVMDLNVKSPFFLTQALAESLRNAASKEKPAKVINVASIDGIRPNPQETYSYQASKAALIHLTRRMGV